MRVCYSICILLSVVSAEAQVISARADTLNEPIRDTVTSPVVPHRFYQSPSYRISIGASFDFLQQLKPAQIYGDLVIDLPDVIHSQKAQSGFLGGLYQIRHLAVDSFIADQLFLTSATPLNGDEPHNDSSIVRLSEAKGRSNLQLDNLYFFASIYRPWHTNQTPDAVSGLFHLFRLGSVRSSRILTSEFERTTNDTVFIASNTDYALLPRNSQKRVTETYWELGYGQMLRHEFDDLALQLAVVGLLSPNSGKLGYTITFNAVGTNTGLVIGAEIRTEPLLEQQLYNIYLAKTIKLKDLSRLVTSY